MRMLEVFSSEKTYLSVILDANYVALILEQILHYMVQKGKLPVLYTNIYVVLRIWIIFVACVKQNFKIVSYYSLSHRSIIYI